MHTSCATDDWNTPWCSADAVYAGRWGECVCDRLRRGLAFSGAVAVYRDGPMVESNAFALDSLLAPLGAATNGSLDLFLPWCAPAPLTVFLPTPLPPVLTGHAPLFLHHHLFMRVRESDGSTVRRISRRSINPLIPALAYRRPPPLPVLQPA